MSSLIYSNNKKISFHQLTKTMTSIGEGPDFDIEMTGIIAPGLSILNETDGIKVFTLESNVNKNIRGNFNKFLKTAELFNLDQERFFIVVPHQTYQNQSSDWDYKLLPKSPEKMGYPDDLLNFFLSQIKNSRGILFYLKDDYLQTLAKKDIQVKDNTELIISDLLKQKSEETIIEVNGLTHSMIFNSDFINQQFILVRSQLSATEEAVLYISTDNLDELQKGLLYSLFHFATHSLQLHLFHRQKRLLKRSPEEKAGNFYIGKSLAMKRIKEMVEKIAKTDLSILIHGETGTGKEILVNHLYKTSLKPKLVTVNCAAIPKDLAESVLFGHAKGSFTGAVADQLGKIEEADGGILFLDEIAELNLETQAKLLRVLQDHIVQPIGKKEKKIKIRVIAATHKNLLEMIKEGKFREDLYFRLNEATLNLPALRERKDDIETLANLFLEEVTEANQLPQKHFSTEAISELKKYSYPGNIRELKTIVRKLAILSEQNTISKLDVMRELPQTNKLSEGEADFDLQAAKKQFIQSHVEKVLKLTGDNRTQAAKLLGISPRSLFRMLSDENDLDTDNDVIDELPKLPKSKETIVAPQL